MYVPPDLSSWGFPILHHSAHCNYSKALLGQVNLQNCICKMMSWNCLILNWFNYTAINDRPSVCLLCLWKCLLIVVVQQNIRYFTNQYTWHSFFILYVSTSILLWNEGTGHKGRRYHFWSIVALDPLPGGAVEVLTTVFPECAVTEVSTAVPTIMKTLFG